MSCPVSGGLMPAKGFGVGDDRENLKPMRLPGPFHGDVRRAAVETTAAFVAVIDGQVVAWANLDRAEVDQLHVDPDHGGIGLARRLV